MTKDKYLLNRMVDAYSLRRRVAKDQAFVQVVNDKNRTLCQISGSRTVPNNAVGTTADPHVAETGFFKPTAHLF